MSPAFPLSDSTVVSALPNSMFMDFGVSEQIIKSTQTVSNEWCSRRCKDDVAQCWKEIDESGKIDGF
jgi:hypothetical protein